MDYNNTNPFESLFHNIIEIKDDKTQNPKKYCCNDDNCMHDLYLFWEKNVNNSSTDKK